jgi:AraC-like DNA-binding protein
MMQVLEHAPRNALRPFIERFMVVEFPSFHRDAHLPDVRPVAAFSFRGRVRIDGDQWAPPAAFTGLREALRGHEHWHEHAVLLATFAPVGAAAFLRPSLEEFVGTTTDLAGLLAGAQELEELSERLALSQSDERRVMLVKEFLLARVRLSAPEPLVSAAVTWLERDPGNKRIDDLARYIGLSQSALERRFRRVVGVSPKRFASVMRLQRAVQLRASGADFTSVAHAAGYFDQSHFIHDFRRATGSSPDAFFRRASPN